MSSPRVRYVDRFYRKENKPKDLFSYEVKIKESDLLICSSKNLSKEALQILKKHREQIENYIKRDPQFAVTLKPYQPLSFAPLIIKKMAEAGRKCGVGPMASVAGAISQFVGEELLKLDEEVIVENGGDIFMKTKKKRKISIFSGDSLWEKKLILKIKPDETPLGICTSSGKIGPSLSFGRADAVVVLSPSAILADAVATAGGNMVKLSSDIQKALKFCRSIEDIRGVIIVLNEHLGIWGKIELEEEVNI